MSPSRYRLPQAFIALLLCLVPGSRLRGQIQPLPKGISVYHLNNGLQVLLIENPALPMVGVNLAVKVGSAHETFTTSGMSHMLEHLLFNGTSTRDQKRLYEDVDRLGGYNNASTAEFYTNYMMVTPTENIRKGMEIQADMVFNSIFPVEKFKKEQGIVLEEIAKSLGSAQEQLERNTLSVLYARHALSLPTLGTYSTIEAMTRDGVHAFYKNNYVPNNMILSVIGHFQTPAMLTMIKEIYGQASPGQVTRSQDSEWFTGFQVPLRIVGPAPALHHRFYDGENRAFQVFYHLPEDATQEYFQLVNLVLEKHKDALQTSLKTDFPSLKSLKMSTRPSHLGNYLEVVILLHQDADYEALLAALTKKMAGLDFQLPIETVQAETTKARTEFAKNLEKPHMFGIYNANELVKNGIEGVLASFNGAGFSKAARELQTFRIGSHPFVMLQTPSAQKGLETVVGAISTKLFQDEKRGKTLIVLQNDAGNLLAIHYLVKHKASLEKKFGKDAAKVLHECLDQRLRSEANQKLSSQFGLTFTVNDNPNISMDDIYLHPDFGYLRVEGLADNVPAAVHYLHAQFQGFMPTEAEFRKAVEKFKSIGLMQMGGDKSKKAFDELYRSLIYQPDPYSQGQPELTYENLKAFAKEYFLPANMVVSVVSPLAPAALNALFDELGYAPLAYEPEAFTPTFALATKPETLEKTLGGERAYLSWGFVTPIDPVDAPALQALSLLLADDIVFDIREKQGMAYNLSAGIEVIKDKALFFVTQGTRPANVEKLVPQYPQFFRPGAVEALTPEKLEKSINMYLGRMMFRRLSSVNQAFYLGSSMYFFQDPDKDSRFLADLRKVKVADVTAVAKKYLHIHNPFLIVVK